MLFLINGAKPLREKKIMAIPPQSSPTTLFYSWQHNIELSTSNQNPSMEPSAKRQRLVRVLVDRIIMLARPQYPYMNQLRDPLAFCYLRDTDRSLEEWDGHNTFNAKRDNGNYRHAYFAHDPDTARRHFAWKTNAECMTELLHWAAGVAQGSYAVQDMLSFLRHKQLRTCQHPEHGPDGMDCLRSNDPIECQHPYYEDPDTNDEAYDQHYEI